MSEEMLMWVEVVFNISYLLVVWGLVVVMFRNRAKVQPGSRALVWRILLAFAFLALGDTGHVGFRVLAYAQGGLSENPTLVGMGALSTAYTVTLFYMLMVDAWRLRFGKAFGKIGWFLLACGAARMIVMAFPQNQWQQIVAPYEWSLFRNAILVVQGVGVMGLILRDAIHAGDRTFAWIGAMIALSYAFYVPVILWVAQIPLLGMLMIPKTCAYVGIAVIAYRGLFLTTEGGEQIHPRSAMVSQS